MSWARRQALLSGKTDFFKIYAGKFDLLIEGIILRINDKSNSDYVHPIPQETEP